MQNLSELTRRLVEAQVEAVRMQSMEVELPFGRCCILGVDALIRAKEAMNRDHDRITVRQLLEIKRRQAPT